MLDKPKVIAPPKAVKPVEAVAPSKTEDKPVEAVKPAVKAKAVRPKPAKPVEVEVKPAEKVEEKPAAPEPTPESPEPRPRLRVIHKLLNPAEGEPKPKRVTEMSGLWKQAQAKGIKGYNKMKKADLLKALA